ncbi:toll/interleukin-1 receptor domain-containing protein [Sphingomonas sp.]|uniref:toll/interleukin-1 receptor domain-containing protein n=1 Tax=Sphingomonas sp. TaxID=28214 RepID=UPI00286E0B79|nr:toll/interleukin-1 receptor domain-containing protein [Sphingomonas sp.]
MPKLARVQAWVGDRDERGGTTAAGSAAPLPAGVAAARYYAFLSYSHQDEAMADWLHRSLEGFRVPPALTGRETATGTVPARLSPIFRDRRELAAAGNLSDEIRDALEASRFLIVLCSPAAAKSRWTNAEIEMFKRRRPDGCVLAAIVDGEPFASELPGREEEECLPPALRLRYDRRGRPTTKRAEPLAADLRAHRDGRRMGLLKLIAGMLGVGLDELVQRDTLRRQRRLAWLAAASLAGMAMTSGLAIAALDARDAARDQRRAAEGLVGFMLGDLKDKLEPLGRLDVLDAVGARALEYYRSQDKAALSDDSLAQRSRALTLMGGIASSRGDLAGALRRYQEALAGSEEALRRAPDDPQRIFDHAQNVFWVSDIAWQRGQIGQAEAAMREYKRLARRLVALDPNNPRWRMEPLYADTNLGAILVETRRYGEAAAIFQSSLGAAEALAAAEPGNTAHQKLLSEGLAWLAEAREKEGRLDDALAQRERQIGLLERLIATPNSDAAFRQQAMIAERAAGRLYAMRGDLTLGLEHLRKSVAIGAALMRSEPGNADWAGQAASSYLDLGEVQLAAGRGGEAGVSARAGCDIAQRLARRDTSVEAWRVDLRGACWSLRARLALTSDADGEAAALAAQLVRAARAEVARAKSADARFALANAQLIAALVATSAGDRAAAHAGFDAALGAWPKGVAETPALTARRVVILDGLGRTAEAEAAGAKLAAIGYRHPIYLRDRRLISLSQPKGAAR